MPDVVTRALITPHLPLRLALYRDLIQDLVVEVLNAAGSVEVAYSFADLEILSEYTISTRNTTGARVGPGPACVEGLCVRPIQAWWSLL